MNYNKKQIQPLIDKFKINPETNQLFGKIIEMYDNQPNYQLWAVKGVFSNTFDFETLAKIHDWSVINQTMIKNLDKKNIVSYSNKQAITQLLHEMSALDNVMMIKDIISHFNTEQRKMLTEAILPREINGLKAHQSQAIKTWGNIFSKFNRLSQARKNNFYTKASSITDVEELKGLIKDAIDATYLWDKEDFLAYIGNNTKDVDIVYNKDSYVIIRVPNFETSKKLCGGGRTQWCISMKKEHWDSYVGESGNRDQYFLFDFKRRETDPFAHIGFTIQKGCGIVEAQSCDNEPMLNKEFSNGVESFTIHSALAAAGAKMSAFVHLNKNSEFDWNVESLMNFIRRHPDLYAIAYNKDGRYVINCMSSYGLDKLANHTMINITSYPIDANNKTYVIIDMNLPVNDDKAIVVMRFVKDVYGETTLRDCRDLFNSNLMDGKYLDSIGMKSCDFLGRETIDPSVKLHKLIDEHDEAAAIKLIDDNINEININYVFDNRVPAISALNAEMFTLFGKIISHPSFDNNITDGFGETILQAVIYTYSSETIASSKEDETKLVKIINAIMDSNIFNYNDCDFTNDTALTISCAYPKMNWLTKKLISNKCVDVNHHNIFNQSPVTICIKRGNLEMLKELGKRPDLVITDEDGRAAANAGINLKDFIKPDNSVLVDVNSMESLLSELESAATVATR